MRANAMCAAAVSMMLVFIMPLILGLSAWWLLASGVLMVFPAWVAAVIDDWLYERGW